MTHLTKLFESWSNENTPPVVGVMGRPCATETMATEMDGRRDGVSDARGRGCDDAESGFYFLVFGEHGEGRCSMASMCTSLLRDSAPGIAFSQAIFLQAWTEIRNVKNGHFILGLSRPKVPGYVRVHHE
jgi:hypothetical protein